ncbi:MAG TPA: hypothetical protein VFJ14_10270 [Nocardioidaceae bacterium]|nr:hypothetical protein [Nocardioidaceae bacterium]
MKADLLPCVVKGCAWRGEDEYGCPIHSGETDAAWDRQWMLMPESFASRKHTRHR